MGTTHSSFESVRVSSEHIGQAHIAAETPVLAAIPVDADVRLPRISLRGFHPQAHLAPDAAALPFAFDYRKRHKQITQRSYTLCPSRCRKTLPVLFPSACAKEKALLIFRSRFLS